MKDERQERKLMGLNYAQLVLGVIVSAGTVVSLFATYITLPTKVGDIQEAQTNIWSHINKMDDARLADREILIRMDERLKSIQADQAEIKSDLKTLRKEPLPD